MQKVSTVRLRSVLAWVPIPLHRATSDPSRSTADRLAVYTRDVTISPFKPNSGSARTNGYSGCGSPAANPSRQSAMPVGGASSNADLLKQMALLVMWLGIEIGSPSQRHAARWTGNAISVQDRLSDCL